MQITIAIKRALAGKVCFIITQKHSTFRHVSLLFKTVHTYMVKLMKKKKVKTRTTRSQCQSAHRRTRDEKRQAEACFD
ncbi:hypothetical protein T4B_819 [Trichinella pseudospiralis]|uniref:Uncharacterized protein n=1 Tax=Trichinella pseudospiralis TaxID=6337 RepID=A0A0V1HLB6_TRIPS|nr:hypothetical protein T4B_819 [Trichinella pseudospiralis]